MHSLRYLFLLTTFLLNTRVAQAGSTDAKERTARMACLSGDYAKGVAILSELFVDTKDPNYIYNQARCFEQNGKNDQAILRFREFLRTATSLSKTETDAVLKKIDELRDSDRIEAKSETVPAPTPAAVPAPVPVASAVSPSVAATTPDPLGISQSAPTPEPEQAPPVYKRWWFWTGVGAVVAGGVVTGILLSSKSSPKSPACISGNGVTCVP